MLTKPLSKEELQADYLAHRPRAEAFLREFIHQFAPLIGNSNVKLGVPIEGRVKDWPSLEQKLDRKSLALTSCKDLPDLIGVRAMTLFSRDEDTLCKLIKKTFSIQQMEDKADALGASTFGYISRHFIVKIPKNWRKVPAFKGLDYTVELQVRTLSQHLWAAASHVLQYKKESDVPPAVTRSIHRVAAILELADLEFERVLKEREGYSKSQTVVAQDAALDADNLRVLLDGLFPLENKGENESYSALLSDLLAMGIDSVGKAKSVVERHMTAILEIESKMMGRLAGPNNLMLVESTKQRVANGVFYTHVGLARVALGIEYKDKWSEYRATTRERFRKKIVKTL
jgi:putative GTP pyrophosphokinase